MRQPLSLFLLASSAAAQNCQSMEEVRALEVPKSILPSVERSFDLVEAAHKVVSRLLHSHFSDPAGNRRTQPIKDWCIRSGMSQDQIMTTYTNGAFKLSLEKQVLWVLISNPANQTVGFNLYGRFTES